VTVPAAAVKVAELAPAAAVTEAGTVRKEVLPESANVAPPAGAGWLRMTVQVAALLESKLEGLHCREAGASEDTKVREVVRELLPNEAVIVAV